MPHSPILCVDDEPSNLAVLRETLQGEHRLVFARSGPEALRAVAKHQPSLILLDICMPDMDGYEVCRRLKADPASEKIPVIFITALSETVNERTGFDLGCVDYIAKPISPPIVQARVNTHLSLVRAAEVEKSHHEALRMLGKAGDYNDTDTGVHVWRMAAYCKALSEALGWERWRAELLELAAPMHDIGKIGIPDAILQKPGKLDAQEMAVMRNHARIGYEILKHGEAPLFRMAADIALHHHEKWDGSGYPDGLAGEAIPEPARITAIADVFDALTMRRPYKEPWPLDRTLATIRESSGSHFDPRLVEAFFGILPRIKVIKEEWDARDKEGH